MPTIGGTFVLRRDLALTAATAPELLPIGHVVFHWKPPNAGRLFPVAELCVCFAHLPIDTSDTWGTTVNTQRYPMNASFAKP